jgi:hypothetical protein
MSSLSYLKKVINEFIDIFFFLWSYKAYKIWLKRFDKTKLLNILSKIHNFVSSKDLIYNIKDKR